jgi:hypothetical protein
MKIALVHYHLKTGGVTTVIKRQIAAIQGACDTLVLTGDRAATRLPCEVVEIPELGYDRAGVSPPLPDRVAQRVLKVLSDRWPGGCDVLHVHNPTLAKNRQLLKIIKRLQQAGVNFFLQIHDFAEDGRPDVYTTEDYPANCHYGVINARDAAILRGAGLDGSGLHHLPNAIEKFSVNGCQFTKPQILYPVRALRRKNLGEAILLSMFFTNNQRLAVTQPPNSPKDILIYRGWIDWVRKHRLHVDFEVGKTVDFSTLLKSSESVITTSISEGFGLSFLETWTTGKLLWGRRLADICEDFEASRIRLDCLYNRLDVPLAWIDAEAFSHEWQAAVLIAAARYGHMVAPNAVNRALARLTRDEMVDFGMLSEKFQRQILAHLISKPVAKVELIALNPWLSNPGVVSDSTSIIENNRRAVLQHYGTRQYRHRLLHIYDQTVNHPVCHRIDKGALLDAFFDLDRFSLLKWGAHDE